MSPELISGRTSASQQVTLDGLDGYPHRWFGRFPDQPVVEGADEQPDTFAAAMAELALTIRREGVIDDQHALAVITRGAVAVIAGAEQAAVMTAVGPKQLAGNAVYGDLPPRVMELQNTIGEGPCLEALNKTSQVLVTDLRTDSRWPRFAGAAAQLGVRSMLCTPLAAQDRILGSLTLSSAQPDAFDGESMAVAAVFAAHATLALLGVHQVRDLNAMADTRDLIGQAKGILMERYKIAPDAAFRLLLTASQNTNVKLRRVCEQLADTGELAGTAPAPA